MAEIETKNKQPEVKTEEETEQDSPFAQVLLSGEPTFTLSQLQAMGVVLPSGSINTIQKVPTGWKVKQDKKGNFYEEQVFAGEEG